MVSIIFFTFDVLDSLFQLNFCRLIGIAQPGERCSLLFLKGAKGNVNTHMMAKEKRKNYLFLLEPGGVERSSGRNDNDRMFMSNIFYLCGLSRNNLFALAMLDSPVRRELP